MALPKSITMTPNGGNYWRAKIFRVAVAYTSLPLVLLVLGTALVNPFWFRHVYFEWVVRQLNKYTSWINYRQYAIYLGTDPKVWHTLNGDIK